MSLPDQNTIKSIGLNTLGNMLDGRASGHISGGFAELDIGHSAFKEGVGQTIGDAPSAIIDQATSPTSPSEGDQ